MSALQSQGLGGELSLWAKSPPEYQLLLCCGRTVLAERHIAAVSKLLDGHLAWPLVLELASWHRLSGLLFHNLRRSEFNNHVPQRVMQDLEEVYYGNFARNMSYQAELGKALTALQAEGIPAIVLKGAALAEAVYQDIGLRPMVDLDIMVHEGHIDRADSVVRGLGFLPRESPDQQKKMRETHRHYPALVSPDQMVPIEIHRHIVESDSPFHFELAGFWTRARGAAIAGTQALVLAPEDQLTHLCLNCFLDRKYRSSGALGQLCDISETILHNWDTVDWDLFNYEAHQHNLAGPIYCTLFTVKELTGTAPPGNVLKDLEPESFSVGMAQRFIEKRVLRAGQWVPLEFVRPRKNPWRRLFPDQSYLAQRYGWSGSSRWIFWLYLRRMVEGSKLLSQSLSRPWDMGQDLRINRWLQSLYGSGEPEAPRRPK